MNPQRSATSEAADTGIDLAERLVEVYSTYRGAEEIFDPEALFDINVPSWRFQVQGPQAFIGWLKGYSPDGYRLKLLNSIPTSTGFMVELEGEYRPHGHDLYFRNLIACQVEEGRIKEVLYYCTGDWDPETRAHHAAEVQLIRP